MMNSRVNPLTFRLAQTGDFDEIVKFSEGIYQGHDYLPFTFHQWLQRDNLVVVLAYSGDKLVGLQACFVVDDGRTLILRAERILAELRGQGLMRQLREFAREYTREHYPNLQRERFVTINFDDDQTKLLEHEVLSYQVKQEFFSRAEISELNSMDIEPCSREYFSDIILSGPVKAQLFPDNVIVVHWCPFEPLRSNIDHMLQECSEVFVEKTTDDTLPRSLSFGTFSQRVKFVEWKTEVYTDDPVLYEAHLLRQFKRACEVISGQSGDFIFTSLQDNSLAPLGRKLMEEQLQLKVCDWYYNTTIKLYERDVTK